MSPEELQEQEEVLDISFVFEDWVINYRKAILQQMQNASEEEKRARAEELSLLNLFKLRRTRDLGFNYHIYSEIQNDEDFLISIKKTIGKIVSTVADAPHKLREKLQQGAMHLENILPFDDVPNLAQMRLLETVVANRNKTRVYLADRILKGLAEGDYDDVQATQSLLTEFIIDKDRGYEVLKHHGSLEGSFYGETYHYTTLAFLFQHVRFFDVYYAKFDPFIMSLASDCASILQNSIKTLLETIVGATEDDWLLFNRLINNLLSISSVMWFISKPKREKLRLLNTIYPLAPVVNALTQELHDHTKSGPSWIFGVSQTLNILHTRGYFAEIIRIIHNILANADPQFLFFLYDELATAYRELGDYEAVLKAYSTANEFVAYLDGPSSYKTYRETVCMIRIAEAHRQLGHEGKWAEYVTEIKERLRNSPDRDTGKILLNLAGASRRVLDFKAEERYLSEALDYLPERLANSATKRLEVLYSSDPFSVGSLDITQLAVLEIEEHFEQLIAFGEKALAAFNFEKAIEHFTKAYILVKPTKNDRLQVKALGLLGYVHYQLGKVREAKAYNETLLKLDPRNLGGLAYLTVAVLTLPDDDPTSRRHHLQFVAQHIDLQTYLELLTWILYYLIQTRDLVKLTTDITTLAPLFPITPDTFYLDAGNILADNGIAEGALFCYDKALSHAQDPTRRAEILTNIGSIYANQDQQHNAINWYRRALDENPCFAYTYGNMAASYGLMIDSKSALKYIRCAIELAKDDPKLAAYSEKLRFNESVYESMLKHQINLNKIPPAHQKIKDTLITAEKDFIDAQRDKTKRKPDASGIIGAYAKALEMMLHEKISRPFLDYLDTQFGTSIPPRIWDSSGWPFQRLIYTKGAKSLTPGQWKRIVADFKTGPMGLTAQLKLFIASQMETILIGRIAVACEVLTDPRNFGLHSGILTIEEVAKLRPNVIEALNNVIDVLY